MKKHLMLSLGMTFIAASGILIGLLYLSACIPREAIRDNLLESAEYLEENEEEFYYIKENNGRTLIDNYADTIVFNIMYSVKPDYRMVSLITSPFYSDSLNSDYQMISLLRNLIEEEKAVDTVYDRYWHGMQMILRPLFVFLNLKQIRSLMTGLLIILLGILIFQLWKKEQRVLALSMIAGAVLVAYPMIGICMEYVPTFLIMLLISFVCLKYYKEKNIVIHLLLISGMCSGFFDFLTTETVTVVIPLAIVLCLRQNEKNMESFAKEMQFVAVSGFVWGIGYLGVLISKWLLSGMVLQRNRFMSAVSMAAYRQGAEVTVQNENGVSQPLAALAKNIRLLAGFPLDMEYETVLVITAIGIGILACFVYLYRKTGKECILPTILALLACVPVVRILILNSHSYQHSFFTYRALFASICCIITAVAKVVDMDLLRKKQSHMNK